ncbi:MAG: hypothetical protein ACOZCL_12815 [Bacillota bacterium]
MSRRIIANIKGHALVKYEDIKSNRTSSYIRYEWWTDMEKMKNNTYMEDLNGVTKIYCCSYENICSEEWLLRQFIQRYIFS